MEPGVLWVPLLLMDVLSWGRGGSFTSGHHDRSFQALPSPKSAWAPCAQWWEPILPGNTSPPCPSNVGAVPQLKPPSDRFVIQPVTVAGPCH